MRTLPSRCFVEHSSFTLPSVEPEADPLYIFKAIVQTPSPNKNDGADHEENDFSVVREYEAKMATDTD